MPFSRSQSILNAARSDERACPPTGRTCEVRVHEQIRRNTGPAERVHPGSPETKPAEASSQRLGGFRVPHAAGKRLETPQNVLPPTRPGSNARMLVPETMVGRGGCAASSPPQSLHRDRDLSSFRRSPLAPYDRASRGGRAKLPPAPVDPWATRQASPIAEHQLIRRKQAQQIPQRSLQWKGPTNKDRIRQGGTCPIDQRCNQRGMRCHYERDRTGDIHADSVEIIENRMALCAG